ncbi:MAG: RimK family alpha-L-glutamate ligase [bacterium]
MRIGILSASTQGAELHENKRLSEEIQELGHEPEVINYRRTAVAVTEEGRILYGYDDNDSPYPIEVDAVIPRVGKFVEAGAMTLRLLTSKNIYSTADPSSIERAKSKMLTHIMLDSNGIPTPHSIHPTGTMPEKPRETLSLLESDRSRPIILKTNRGSHGKGVVLADTRRSAISIAQAFQSEKTNYLMQEFAQDAEDSSLTSDIRLFVVENQIIAAMKRQAKDEDEFRSNLKQGGDGMIYEPTPRETELALKACEIMDLQVAGVDIIPSRRGPLVNEVNVSPEFGIEKVTSVNVARAIAELAIRKAGEKVVLLETIDEQKAA